MDDYRLPSKLFPQQDLLPVDSFDERSGLCGQVHYFGRDQALAEIIARVRTSCRPNVKAFPGALGWVIFVCVWVGSWPVLWAQSGGAPNPFLPNLSSAAQSPMGTSLPPMQTPPTQIAPPTSPYGAVPPTVASPGSIAIPGGGVPNGMLYSPAPGGYGAPGLTQGAMPGQTFPNGSMNPGLTFPSTSPGYAIPPSGTGPATFGNPMGGMGAATPSFDPFAQPTYNTVPPGYPNLPPPSAGMFTNPFATPSNDSATVFGAPGSGGLLNNPDAYGSQTWSAQSWQRFWQKSDWQKLWHAFRMRHTFVGGDTANRVQINDTEIATSLSLPNFLGSNMPLTISPGFGVHLWSGPNSFVTGDDLPGSAYSAYLAFDHSTPIDQQLGGEFNFTTGVYSDFDTFTQHSLRFTGVGLVWLRLSPNTTFKFGAEYLDRLAVKLLPAGGIFWSPDPGKRLSFYFPRPKFAFRFPNFGNAELWGYVSGEYGGGSWTIKRAAGFSDQVDLNDFRIMAGLEWIGLRGVTGFGEIGYVFERQIIYRSTDPLDNYLGTAIMFRGGFAY